MHAKPVPIFILAFGLVSASLLTATVASAADDADNYTIEEVQACSGDAMKFCRDALPDIHKIESCMEAKKAQLSKACQAMFTPGRSR